MAAIAMAIPEVRQALPAFAFAIFVVLLWRLSRVGRRPKGYPPGPPTLPVVGNLHQIPNEKMHLQFDKWAKEYGPIYSVMLGTRVWVVLSADFAIRDLVDKRGHIYASRPDLHIAQHVISGGLRVLFMEANETWRKARKRAHRVLKLETARTYVPYQDLENKAMLLGMLEHPKDFIDHLRLYPVSLTTQMTFGFRTPSIHDKRFKEAFDIFDIVSELTTDKTAALLDFFPMLRRLPDFLLPIKKQGREIHRRELQLVREYYLETKQKLKDGTAKPCISLDLVKMQKEEGFSDDLAAYMGGSVLQAGSETTSAILVGFVQAMIIYPEVAKKAQEEIDRVCGDRLPDLNDILDMPYIRATMKESLRWTQSIPLGVPHAATEDNEYRGYRIPKNATVIMNVWHIHSDPARYPNPREFNPMRFWGDGKTSADASNSTDAAQRDHFVFGAGLRKCVGMHIADRSLFLGIARLLWAFNLGRARDPHSGREIVPNMDDLTKGMVVLPRPFPADIRPRSADKARRVREEWARAAELLDDDMQWRVVPEGLIWRDYEPAE